MFQISGVKSVIVQGLMSIQHNCAEYINCQIYKNVCRIQKVFCRLQYDEVSIVLSYQYPVFSPEKENAYICRMFKLT